MKVFVAGATRTVGRPLVARLLEIGHDVVGTTRREDRAADLRAQGVEPVVVDALDADALATAAWRARPEVVFQQLTALPQAGTAGASDHAATSLAAGRKNSGTAARAHWSTESPSEACAWALYSPNLGPRNGCRRGHSTLRLTSWRGRQAYGKSGQTPTRGTTPPTKLDTNGRVASGEGILRSRWCSVASFRKEAGAGCSPVGQPDRPVLPSLPMLTGLGFEATGG